MKVDQKLIAEKAGVSRTTVSVVLNGKNIPVISEETRAHVLKVAESLGYILRVRKKSAQTSGSEGTMNIGLFMRHGVNFSNSFYSALIESVQEEASKNGFHLIFAINERDCSSRLPSVLSQRKCDGIILLGQMEAVFVEEVRKTGIPMVNIAGSPENIDSVMADNFMAVKTVMDYLAASGHKKIAYLGGDEQNINFLQRRMAYSASFVRLNGCYNPDLIVNGDGSFESALDASAELMSKRDCFTAVLACNDTSALALMSEFRKNNISVPGDISVAGIDNLPESVHEGLTTAAIRKKEMGVMAVRVLLRRIKGDDSPVSSSIIPVFLVERASVQKI